MKTFFIILLTLPFSLLAQKEVGSQFIYTGLNYSPNTVNQLLPIIGFYHVDKRNNLNDFQLNQIGYKKGPETNAVNLSCSYHKIIGLNKKSDSKFYLGLGLGASLYYFRAINRPLNPAIFLAANTKIGTVLSIQPTLNYNFTEKFFLGISANAGIVDQSISFARYENPNIPVAQQKQVQFPTRAFDLSKLSFNATIGFKIN